MKCKQRLGRESRAVCHTCCLPERQPSCPLLVRYQGHAQVIYRYMCIYMRVCTYGHTWTHTYIPGFTPASVTWGGSVFLIQLLWISACKMTDPSLSLAAGHQPGTSGHVLLHWSEGEVSFALPLFKRVYVSNLNRGD